MGQSVNVSEKQFNIHGQNISEFNGHSARTTHNYEQRRGGKRSKTSNKIIEENFQNLEKKISSTYKFPIKYYSQNIKNKEWRKGITNFKKEVSNNLQSQ